VDREALWAWVLDLAEPTRAALADVTPLAPRRFGKVDPVAPATAQPRFASPTRLAACGAGRR